MFDSELLLEEKTRCLSLVRFRMLKVLQNSNKAKLLNNYLQVYFEATSLSNFGCFFSLGCIMRDLCLSPHKESMITVYHQIAILMDQLVDWALMGIGHLTTNR